MIYILLSEVSKFLRYAYFTGQELKTIIFGETGQAGQDIRHQVHIYTHETKEEFVPNENRLYKVKGWGKQGEVHYITVSEYN